MAIKIVRKDKLLAGYNGNLESVMVYDNAGTNTVETSNGVFVVAEGLLKDAQGKVIGRELKKARLAGKADAGLDVLFIHNSEVMYDAKLFKLEDFVIAKGKVARAYRLFDGDIVTLTVDLFQGAVAVGDELVVHTNGLIGKDATALATAKVKFVVIEDSGNELHPVAKAFAVQVVRN